MRAYKDSTEYKNRKKIGQFFTEGRLVEEITKHFKLDYNNKVIVEPSCGNGSFIDGIISTNDKYKKIIGIDIDKKTLSKLNYDSSVELVKKDYLKYKPTDNIDMIIGNPPFNLPADNYFDTTEGFVLKSLDLLNEDGELILILPNTVFRNRCYQHLRNEILNNSKIMGIINTFGYEFLGADIETVALYLIKKKVKKQRYSYISDNEKRVIDLEVNDRQNILINNTNFFKEINKKIVGNTLGSLFDIKRGTSGGLKGRDLDFYDYMYICNDKVDNYIALQNIAFRLTANYVNGDINKVSDTITRLIPKDVINKKQLIMIANYLNSSTVYYQLHTNSLNFSKLTIHIDKYYIEDLLIPTFEDEICDEFIQKAEKYRKKKEMASFRNEFFYNFLNFDKDTIEEIEKYWVDPRYKRKENHNE